LILRHSVTRNIVMSVLRRLSPSGFLSPKAEAAATRQSIANFDIRPPRGDLPVGNLSGGNQQKVVFAKELLQEPKLLLLDEPTRGVDVGAKGEIYARLRSLTQQGLGVLVARSELPELVGLCDRIIVMRQGCSVAEFPGGVDERILLESATGSQERPHERAAWRGRVEPADAFRAARSARPRRALPERDRPRARHHRRRRLLARGHGQLLFLSPDNVAKIIRAIPRPASSRWA